MRRFPAIILLAMLFLVGFIPTKGASRILAPVDSLPIRRAVELTTDGQKSLLVRGDATVADSLFRLAITEDSTYAPAYYSLSQLFAQRRSSLDSVLIYSRAAYQLDSLNKWYSESYAQALAMKGDYAAARRLYQKAIERSPQELNAYLVVAMLFRQTAEPAAALAVLDSAEMRTGKNSYLSQLKQDILISMGQHDKAVAEALALVEVDPQNIDNRMSLADLYVATRQDSLASREYQAAIALDSTSVVILDIASQFYADRSNFPAYFRTLKLLQRSEEESLEQKVATFMRLTSDRSFYAKHFNSLNELATQLYILYPAEKQVVELYADHLIASGNLDGALNLYKRHAKSDLPADYDYYTSIIDIESYRQRPDSVELYASRAIELFPDRHELRLSRANLYAYTKRYDQAIESYKAILPMITSDSLRGAVWGNIGDIYHQKSLAKSLSERKVRSLMRQAYKAYDNALEYNDSNPLVLNNYAYFLSLEQRDLDRALTMAERATSLVDVNPTYLDTYAWVLYELGRYDQAKKIMRQAIALDTTQSSEIQFHYAEILAALGEDFMAEVYYDKALKLGHDPQTIEERKAKLK